MSKYFTDEYQKNLASALSLCRLGMQKPAFKMKDVKTFAQLPANFGRAIQELGIARRETGGSWVWIDDERPIKELALIVARRCRELDKAVNERLKQRKETSPEDGKLEPEIETAPASAGQFELYSKDDELAAIFYRLANIQNETLKVLKDLAAHARSA